MRTTQKLIEEVILGNTATEQRKNSLPKLLKNLAKPSHREMRTE